jgi:hypothetical protein
LVQAFLKKWWVELDFKAPNLPLSLRLKISGCHYNSIYNNTWTKQVKQLSNQRLMSKTLLRHTLIKTNIFDIFVETLSLYIFSIWKSIVYNLFCRIVEFEWSIIIFSKFFKIQYAWPTFQKWPWTAMTIMSTNRKNKNAWGIHRWKHI